MFHQTEETFVQNGGGLAVINLETGKWSPIRDIRITPKKDLVFSLIENPQLES